MFVLNYKKECFECNSLQNKYIYSIDLPENEYFSETDFREFQTHQNLSDSNNLTIISLNIANLFSKLSAFKIFLDNIVTQNNRPDIIILVETHILEKSNNAGYSQSGSMSKKILQVSFQKNLFYASRDIS